MFICQTDETFITPEQFAERMKNIQTLQEGDEECCHITMDNLMCEVLRGLGYSEGIDIFENTSKWYA